MGKKKLEYKLIDYDDKYESKLIEVIFDAYQDIPEYGEPTTKKAKKYLNWLKNHSTFFKIMLIGNRVAGFIAADTEWKKKNSEKIGEIHELSIRKEFWGKGLGHILLDEALKYLKNLGIKKVRLWVGEKNKSAIDFYKKHGFKETGKTHLGWVRMEKRL